jgi:hypothetical protein
MIVRPSSICRLRALEFEGHVARTARGVHLADVPADAPPLADEPEPEPIGEPEPASPPGGDERLPSWGEAAAPLDASTIRPAAEEEVAAMRAAAGGAPDFEFISDAVAQVAIGEHAINFAGGSLSSVPRIPTKKRRLGHGRSVASIILTERAYALSACAASPACALSAGVAWRDVLGGDGAGGPAGRRAARRGLRRDRRRGGARRAQVRLASSAGCRE